MQTIEPGLPLLHPEIRADFRWGDRAAAIHAQRESPGSTEPHPDWFYLELPDGTFHEVQFSRLRHHLIHPPTEKSPLAIARAFEREPEQPPDLLLQLAKACGL